jgi:flagellar motor protein MotB
MVRGQLASTNQQLALAEAAKQQAGERIARLETAAMRQGGATITANSSLRREIEALNIPGLNVRHENDVIRIELPSDQLFQPATANLYQTAYPLIDKVAVAMKDRYPSERITIEAHTDSDVVVGQWGGNDQLTAAQANAVFQILTVRHQMAPGRFQVFGRGSGAPIVSNGTPEGKARNRRVEMVVHTGS